VFRLTPPSAAGGAWMETVLYHFTGGTDGGDLRAGLISDGTGALYGTTTVGGTLSCNSGSGGCGVVFKLTPPTNAGGTWTETVLHTFNFSDGAYPDAGLIMDVSGTLYGTTVGGGAVPAPCSS